MSVAGRLSEDVLALDVVGRLFKGVLARGGAEPVKVEKEVEAAEEGTYWTPLGAPELATAAAASRASAARFR